MEAASDALAPPCRTGDPAVDALLGEKLALAEAKGIPAEISLRLPADGSLDSFDLCVIAANALDNALRACGEAEGEPFLRVRGERLTLLAMTAGELRIGGKIDSVEWVGTC